MFFVESNQVKMLLLKSFSAVFFLHLLSSHVMIEVTMTVLPHHALKSPPSKPEYKEEVETRGMSKR
jgi:hypothetical protein